MNSNFSDKAWLGFIFNEKPGNFEYFGRDINGLVYIHPELERIHFGAEFVYCYKYSGLSITHGRFLVGVGSGSWRYKAFKEGFEGQELPSIWRVLRRKFYYLGVREKSRFHQI